MNTLHLIAKKYRLNLSQKSPIDIPHTSRQSLAELFAQAGFTRGAEIGVEAGLFSQILCQANPQLQLFCIDPWQTYQGYRDHVSQSKLNELYQTTKKRLKNYQCTLIRDFSEKAHSKFVDASLDFVYIDGNHQFLHVAQDLHFWTPKVKKGGIIAGHDFRRDKDRHGYINHVKDVVSAYAYAMHISPWFILRDPHESPSWFWVKT